MLCSHLHLYHLLHFHLLHLHLHLLCRRRARRWWRRCASCATSGPSSAAQPTSDCPWCTPRTHLPSYSYRSVLRRLALHDFEKARAGGAAVGPDDGRAQPILELARTLRLLLGVADVAGAAVTSHVGLLLQQLIDLSFGCDDLRQPSAAKIIGSKQAPAAVPASDVAAAYAAAVIRPMGAVDGWQLYVQERPMLWSVPLYRLLRPTVAAVLSEEGGGSLALPAVRGLIKAQTEAQRSVEEEWVRRTPPLEHAAFAPRGAPPPAPPLTRGYCDEVLGCLLSLQRIQAGDGQRRSRVAGLTHLAAVVRKPAARPCSRAFASPSTRLLFSPTRSLRREAAFAVFLALPELTPAPRRRGHRRARGLPADAAEPGVFCTLASASTRSCTLWRGTHRDASQTPGASPRTAPHLTAPFLVLQAAARRLRGSRLPTARRSGDGLAGGAGGRLRSHRYDACARVGAAGAAVRSGLCEGCGRRGPPPDQSRATRGAYLQEGSA